MAHAGGDGAGGIGGLVELLSEHGEAIDADLQRDYGLSLNDWAAGRVSTRRLLSLIEHLTPEGTAWSRRLSKLGEGQPVKHASPPDWWWTPERDFMARLIDLQILDFWVRSDPNRRGPRPQPIDRPSVRQPGGDPEVEMAPNEARALLSSVAPVSLN